MDVASTFFLNQAIDEQRTSIEMAELPINRRLQAHRIYVNS